MRRKREKIKGKEHIIPWPLRILARITNLMLLLYGYCVLTSENSLKLERIRGLEGWLMRLVICLLSYEI
jgi:hypothetical protein